MYQPSVSMGLAPALDVPVKGTWNIRQHMMRQHINAASLERLNVKTWRWTNPLSLAVTQGIPFGFFSTA